MNTRALLEQARSGFTTVKVGDQYRTSALKFLERWLNDQEFLDYRPQLEHLITTQAWDYLLDCFYQIIPFGTGGRRGEVGIGPNRINVWTIQSSAQGHAQYLLKQYGDHAKTRGVVLTYDVREFFSNKYFNDALPNPVRNLKCIDIAKAAAEVYAANGLTVFLFDGVRTTPELSFSVRHLKAVAGAMFSASHNPPDHNGKKVYDEFGGQLIPPDDEALVDEVTQHVREILRTPFDQAVSEGLVKTVGKEIDEVYFMACRALSLSSARNIKIVYTPLHGCGSTSVQQVLTSLGFKVEVDPQTSNFSGKFEHVTFNIPNPEVVQSFDTPLLEAKQRNADILLNSDPDADRIGVMVNHHGEWVYFNGNEIAALLAKYVISKRQASLSGQGIMIKTDVTTNLITKICVQNQVELIGNLLVGFKYIGAEMNRLEREGKIDRFLMACEESHGYIGGNYIREKDATPAAIWLAEQAAELKQTGKTLVDELHQIYATYGYVRNYLTEIRLPGAEGMGQIQQIQDGLRAGQAQSFGRFKVLSVDDWRKRLPIVSETDRIAKNGLVLHVVPVTGTTAIRITIRPSGTEPKIKMYYEIMTPPFAAGDYARIQHEVETLLQEVERAFMKICYRILGIDFPERGFLLFWQLPLSDKLKYFEIEDQIVKLQTENKVEERKKRLDALLSFLGSDPIEKVDAAFTEKYRTGIRDYLQLT